MCELKVTEMFKCVYKSGVFCGIISGSDSFTTVTNHMTLSEDINMD